MGPSSEVPAPAQTQPAMTMYTFPATGPSLFYEPNVMWDRTVTLDPSLDPSYDRSVVNNGDSSLTLPTPGPASHQDQTTPRRKGRNGDTLAIEEAASFLSPNPSATLRRSGRNANSLDKRTGRR